MDEVVNEDIDFAPYLQKIVVVYYSAGNKSLSASGELVEITDSMLHLVTRNEQNIGITKSTISSIVEV